MDPDKSGRRIKAEGCLRRLLKAFRASVADGVVFANYGQLTIVIKTAPHTIPPSAGLAAETPGTNPHSACFQSGIGSPLVPGRFLLFFAVVCPEPAAQERTGWSDGGGASPEHCKPARGVPDIASAKHTGREREECGAEEGCRKRAGGASNCCRGL